MKTRNMKTTNQGKAMAMKMTALKVINAMLMNRSKVIQMGMGTKMLEAMMAGMNVTSSVPAALEMVAMRMKE